MTDENPQSGDNADPVNVRRDMLDEDRKLLYDLLAKKRAAFGANASSSDAGAPPTDEAPTDGDADGPPPPRLVRMKRGGPRPPFFCVHAVLGSVFPYHRLALHMPDDRSFYGVEARGLDGKEPPYESIPEMAAAYLESVELVQPEGPLHIGGYSFGGYIAYEMALMALAKGRTTSLLAILGVGAPYSIAIPEWERHVRFAAQYFEDLQKLVRNAHLAEAKPGSPPLPDPFAAEASLPPMQRVTLCNMRAQVRYLPDRYTGPVDLFVTEDQELLAKAEPTMGWGGITSGSVRCHTVGGNHLSIFEEPQVAAFASILARRLEEEHKT